MGLPNWILENVLAVEDMYLTPKPRRWPWRQMYLRPRLSGR